MSILAGITKSGKTGEIYIQTSDASDDGSYIEEMIFEDDKPETIDNIVDDAPHRHINIAILKKYHDELGGAQAKVLVVLPPVIYSVNHANLLSIRISTMARFAIKQGYTGYAGKGKAVSGQVNVFDLARGYINILHFMESASEAKVLENPYFFIENGHEYCWEESVVEIWKSAQAKCELFGEWVVAVVGRNARNRANRLRELGWESQEKTTFESLASDELPITLAEKIDFSGYKAAVASQCLFFVQ